MRKRLHPAGFAKAVYGLAALMAMGGTALAAPNDCPGGKLRYGVVPYDASAAFVPLYHQIGALISARLGCPCVPGAAFTSSILR